MVKIQEFDIVLFANEQETALPIKNAVEKISKDKKIALIVGSEGGFSDKEIEALKKIENLKSFTLGKRILRAETASIMLSSIILYELEEYL